MASTTVFAAAPQGLKELKETEQLALAENQDEDLHPGLKHTAEREALDRSNGDLEKNDALDSYHSTTSTDEREDEPKDPSIIDWDGPNDPANPMNWTSKKKWLVIALISAMTFATPLGSTIFAPGVPLVMREFNSTNTELAAFMVSVYILGFAFGPIIIAPLSELYGRVIVVHVSNLIFLIFTIACAVSSNLGMFITFRFFMGVFGSTPLTVGGGIIADLMPPEKRGGAMAIWALGPLMG